MIAVTEYAEPTNTDRPRLTPRELQVLRAIATGASNRRASKLLKCSQHTIKFHVNSILFKFDANTRTQAVVKAMRAGMLDENGKLPEIARTARGFNMYATIIDSYGGSVRVPQSSAFGMAHLWLFTKDHEENEASAHLTPQNCRDMIAALELHLKVVAHEGLGVQGDAA